MAAKNKRLKTLHDFFMPKRTKKNSVKFILVL